MKRTIILVILALCLAVSACAETATVASIMGELNGDVYENEVLGFGCKLEGWHVYSEEEIAQVNQVAQGQMDEQLRKMLEAAQPINIMIAQSTDNTLNVNIQAQDVTSSLAVFEVMGMKSVAENSLSMFKQSLEASGFTDVDLSVGEVVIGEETVTCVKGSYKLSGFPMSFVQPWLIHGNYMTTITLTTIMSDKTDEILQNFYLIP